MAVSLNTLSKPPSKTTLAPSAQSNPFRMDQYPCGFYITSGCRNDYIVFLRWVDVRDGVNCRYALSSLLAMGVLLCMYVRKERGGGG